MEWMRIVLVFAVLTRAIYTDMKEGKIENVCVLIGFVTAGAYSFLSGGGQAFLESMKVAIIILASLLFLFVLKGLGAGDIKLLCVLAAFYPEDAMGIVVISFIVAAGLIIGRMLVRAFQKKTVFISGETMNFSVPVGMATIIVEIMQWI